MNPSSNRWRLCTVTQAIVVSSGEMNPSSNRWRLCTVTQVEEFKCVIRLIPIFITTIALSVSYSQVSTFFMSQSTIMNRNIGEKIVPPGMVVLFISLNPFIIIPIYVCIIVPFLKAFAYVGQLEFFYDQSSQGTRSITSALFLSQSAVAHFLSGCIVKGINRLTGGAKEAVAHFLSGCIVKGINRLTGGAKEGWLRNDLNKSRLDYFYWILCAINAVNLVFYLWAAYVYKGKNDGASGKDLEEDAIWDEEAVFRIIRRVELTENVSQQDSR
ncbi:uncharacterized protein A4U43_C01F12320 [Asparagus officinalis]|uniref:Uncharacterized protein n=1 Tax=Asparagus officinalis TaxID=4686 RepID=A0A5P1FPL2_ASPOF|nr:uncharacterized protein A4U43_C01F12320 [Asparagus officinalis]